MFQRLPNFLDRGPIWSTELSYFMTSEWLRLISQFSPTFLLFFQNYQNIAHLLNIPSLCHRCRRCWSAGDIGRIWTWLRGYERDWEDMKGTDVKWYWFRMDKLMHRALATTIWNISGLMNLHIFFRITQSPEQQTYKKKTSTRHDHGLTQNIINPSGHSHCSRYLGSLCR